MSKILVRYGAEYRYGRRMSRWERLTEWLRFLFGVPA